VDKLWNAYDKLWSHELPLLAGFIECSLLGDWEDNGFAEMMGSANVQEFSFKKGALEVESPYRSPKALVRESMDRDGSASQHLFIWQLPLCKISGRCGSTGAWSLDGLIRVRLKLKLNPRLPRSELIGRGTVM